MSTKRLLLVVAAIATTSLASCVSSKQAIHGGPVVVKGQLFSKETGAPLSGFNVVLADVKPVRFPFGIAGHQEIGQGTADREGRFVITLSDPRKYWKAKKHGQLALLLSGSQPVMGIVGLKEGDDPKYYVEASLSPAF